MFTFPEPVLEFSALEYHVDESDGYARATIQRSGDVSSTVSVICSTLPLTARGSSENRVESVQRSGDVSSTVSVICSTLPLTARGSSENRVPCPSLHGVARRTGWSPAQTLSPGV